MALRRTCQQAGSHDFKDVESMWNPTAEPTDMDRRAITRPTGRSADAPRRPDRPVAPEEVIERLRALSSALCQLIGKFCVGESVQRRIYVIPGN